MLVIGLTGSFGSGKTTVAGMFARCGAKVLDADRMANELINARGACFKPVVKEFGEEILTRGCIDHAKLAQIVFSDLRKLKRLEAIIHPYVAREIKKKINFYTRRKKVKAVVLDVPLLFESGLDKLVEIIIVVRSNKADQIIRIRKKIDMPVAQIKKRIESQMPMSEKVLLSDVVVDNRKSILNTKRQVEEIWKNLFNIHKRG